MAERTDRGLMFDAGLTAVALRGVRSADGHYPFLDRFRSARTRWWFQRLGRRRPGPSGFLSRATRRPRLVDR